MPRFFLKVGNVNDNADAEGASVNLQFPSFAPRHRLSKLISALGLASVATAEALASLRSATTSPSYPSGWIVIVFVIVYVTDFKKKSGHYCFNSKEFVSSQYETKREVKYVYIRAKYS